MASLFKVNALARSAFRLGGRCVGKNTATQVCLLQKRTLPSCILETNLEETQIPEDIHIKLMETLATTLNKDPMTVSVSVRTSAKICRRGTSGPAAVVNIYSVGVFNEESNPKFARTMFTFLSPALQIPPNRILLMFHPVTQGQIGTYLAPEMMQTDKPLPSGN